jgi:endonuclease/exonuclease/phosphatase family metal-dependent hydrolase
LQDIRWVNRKFRICELIRDSDVVVLNEVTEYMIENIIRQLPHFATAIFQRKSFDHDGTAILYSKAIFKLGDQPPTWVPLLREKKFKQVAVMAIVLPLVNGCNELCIAGLHLKSGYGDDEPVRIKQFEVAMNKINKFCGPRSLIVAGDLNSNFLAKYSKAGLPAQFSKYRLSNVAGEFGKQRQRTYNGWHESVFDYVLTRDIAADSFYVPETNERTPNAQQPSDHLPVTATFRCAGHQDYTQSIIDF